MAATCLPTCGDAPAAGGQPAANASVADAPVANVPAAGDQLAANRAPDFSDAPDVDELLGHVDARDGSQSDGLDERAGGDEDLQGDGANEPGGPRPPTGPVCLFCLLREAARRTAAKCPGRGPVQGLREPSDDQNNSWPCSTQHNCGSVQAATVSVDENMVSLATVRPPAHTPRARSQNDDRVLFLVKWVDRGGAEHYGRRIFAFSNASIINRRTELADGWGLAKLMQNAAKGLVIQEDVRVGLDNLDDVVKSHVAQLQKRADWTWEQWADVFGLVPEGGRAGDLPAETKDWVRLFADREHDKRVGKIDKLMARMRAVVRDNTGGGRGDDLTAQQFRSLLRGAGQTAWTSTTAASRKLTASVDKMNELYAGILTSLRRGVLVFTPLNVGRLRSGNSNLNSRTKAALLCARRANVVGRIRNVVTEMRGTGCCVSDWEPAKNGHNCKRCGESVSPMFTPRPLYPQHPLTRARRLRRGTSASGRSP